MSIARASAPVSIPAPAIAIQPIPGSSEEPTADMESVDIQELKQEAFEQ
jgi:hypothetical protein